ncbi:TIGR04255 family protein [Aeromonas caviae]|uniref:TIGR04255 family protein n=1 Tax=Aeromonas TaxID=642 RepID=UPI0009B8F446|nr:TIGR04255 family protein [Aeromonas caviae]
MSNLSYVLGKVGFATIPNKTLKDAIDAIQEKLRRQYPVIGAMTTIEYNQIEFSGAGSPQTVTISHPVLVMTDADRVFGFRLTPDSLFVHTTSYVTYKDYITKFTEIIDSITSVIELTHVNFIGMRYINKYQWDNQAGFSNFVKRGEFLQPELLGLLRAGGNMTSAFLSENKRLVVNSGVTIDSVKYPHDVFELVRDFMIENEVKSGPWAHLDFDSFEPFEKMIPYNINTIINCFSLLHDNIKRAYLDITVN